MKIIDKYILKKFLIAFVFVIFILVAIIVVIDYTEKVVKFNSNDLDVFQILGYYKNYIPWVINLISPITVFIATVFVTAQLAGHTEIIAILSGGTSFRRLMMPYLMGAVIIASFSFYFTGWVIPKANKPRIDFEIAYLKKQVYYFSDRDVHLQVSPDVYLYLQSYNVSGKVGMRFTLERFEGNDLVEKLSANRIKWIDSTSTWQADKWQRRVIHENGEYVTMGQKMDTVLQIHPSDFENDYNLYETLTIPQLEEKIAQIKSRGLDGTAPYEIEKNLRYASPFAIIILTMMGVIISARKARGGTGYQIALGFILAFIFIIFFIVSKGIAEGGNVNPTLAIWMPNIIFSGLGLFMYHTVPR